MGNKYDIVFINAIPHVVGAGDSSGKSWNEVKEEMIRYYEDHILYWKNKDEPRYFDNFDR